MTTPTLDTRKPVDQLAPDDFAAFPIWEFALDEEASEAEPEQDETWVRPVDASAVPADAYSLLVAADLTTASGQPLQGFVGVTTAGALQIGPPILLANGRYLPYLPSAAAFLRPKPHAGEWLAAQLGVPVAELFPLRYTLRVSIDGEAAPRSGNFD